MTCRILQSFLVILLFSSLTATAQIQLEGIVRDPDQKAIPRAKVSLFPATGGNHRLAQTNQEGKFRFESLGQGDYLVLIEAERFRPTTRKLALSQTQSAEFELSIEGVAQTIVVTATDSPEDYDRLAKAVNVVSAEEISKRNEATLADIVRTAPGLQVRQLGGPGALTTIRFRGLRADAAGILIDGMRFRDPSAIAGDASSFIANMTFVDLRQVEVQRGSASSLYGTGSVGGSINLVSNEGGGPTRGTMQVEGGGLGFWRGRSTLSGMAQANRLTYSTGYTHLNVTRGVDGNDANRSHAAQGFLRYDFTPRFRVNGRFYGATDLLQTNVSPGTAGIPASSFPTTGIIRSMPLSGAQVLNLNAGRPVDYTGANFIPGRDDPDSLRSSQFTVSAVRAQYDWRRNLLAEWQYQRLTTNRIQTNGPAGGGFQPAATNRSQPSGSIDNATMRLFGQIHANWRWSAGYEFENEFYRDQQNNGLPAPRSIIVDGRIRQQSHAIYFQQQLTLLGERLLISAAGRMQNFRLDRPDFRIIGTANNYNRPLPAPPQALTGDLSVAYRFLSTGTKLRGHMGNSYRAPGLYERFGGGFGNNPATGQVTFSAWGDPLLRPDRYNTFDVGIDQYLSSNRIRLSATWFYNRIKQLTAFDSSGIINVRTDPWGRSIGYLNGVGGISRGVELSAEARFRSGSTMNGSYTFTHAVNDRDFQVGGVWNALSTPRHTATLVISQTVGRRGDLTVDLFHGSSYLMPFFAVNRTRAFLAPGFTKADLVGGYRLWSNDSKQLRLYLKLENWFNQNYYENGWRTPGIWALSGLQFSF